MAIITLNNNSLSSVTALPAAIATGKVLQVVQGSTDTQVEASFSSSTDVGLSVSITPSSTGSKVLIIVQCAGCGTRDTSTYYRLTLRRDSTNLVDGFAQYVGNASGSGVETYPNTVYLDSPNTTSAISYNLRATRQGGTANCYFNHSLPAFSTIAAMEIEG